MESSGGILKGTELIQKIYEDYNKQVSFIIMSGNDVVCDIPNVNIWGKPLPCNDIIHNTITTCVQTYIEEFDTIP